MLTIRPLRPWDSAFCWWLANEPSVRAASHNPEPPTVFGHLKWMARWLFGRDRQAWVLEVGQPVFEWWVGGNEPVYWRGERAALVRVERPAIRRTDRESAVTLSVAVLPAFRGQGIAQAGIKHASLWVLQQGWGIPLARIRSGNVVSQLAFRAAGFDVWDTRDGWVTMLLGRKREPA